MPTRSGVDRARIRPPGIRWTSQIGCCATTHGPRCTRRHPSIGPPAAGRPGFLGRAI